MSKRLLSLSLWLFTAVSLIGQVPTYRQVLDDLAYSIPGSNVTLPDAFFAQPESSAAGNLQRGVVLYTAVGRANEVNNRDRGPDLLAAAKSRLQYAAVHLGGAPKAQAYYTLGQIAEQYEANLAVARSYYQAAIDANASHTQARRALARVQRLRNP